MPYNKTTLIKIALILLSFQKILFAQHPEFDARGLIYLQDGDFNANTLITNKIEKTGIDLVGAFTFPMQYAASQHPSEQNISNSAINNHRSIAIRSDKRIAYILESKGNISKGKRESEVDSLPDGEYISVLNISNLKGLKPEFKFQISANPTALALDASDKYLAVSSSTPGNEINIFELDDFGKPLRLLPPVIHLDEGTIDDVFWLPGNNFLAFIKKSEKALGLIKVVRDRNVVIRLEQFGEVVKFEGKPICGMASRDGKGIFLLDAGNAENTIRGKVFYIKLSNEEEKKHILLSSVEVGFAPTQMTMHPNGENILVTNSGKPGGNEASISILSYRNDLFEQKSTLPLDGLLPGAAIFDRNGRNFAISIFQTHTFGKPMGNIAFYKFTPGNNPKAEKQALSINVPIGVHILEAIN